MEVFYLTLVLVYIFSLSARLVRTKNEKHGVFFLIIVITILVLVSGLRNGIGDTGMYKHLYRLIGPEYNSNEGYEKGFIIFLKILKSISDDPQFMIFITSLIINVINVSVIYNLTKNSYFEIGMFMYIASGYYTVTMNGIRQSLAAAFIFLATYLIIKGKFKMYLLVILILTSIHNSAFVMIPTYFVVRQKAWSKKIGFLFAITLVGLLLYDPLMNIVMGALSDSRYGSYADFNEGGANIIRIAVFIVPVILAYLKRDVISEKWNNGDILVNMNCLCLIIMLFSGFNWIFARFTIYFQLYSFILLPYIITNCFSGKERRLFYLGLIGCYFIFFYYDQAVTMNMKYTSDFSINQFLYIN